MKYMFDTNIFNEIIDGDIDINTFRGDNITCCVTHIQRDEINKTKDETRRKNLNHVFADLDSEMYPTETMIVGVSRIGMCKLSNGDLYSKIKNRLDKLNRKKSKNNGMDALIGETAIKNNLVLVTHDMEFYKSMTELKCATANVYQVIKLHEKI